MTNSPFGFPVNFDFYNEQGESTLFINDSETGQDMTLVLSNSTNETVYFETSDNHFELVFRPGTLQSISDIRIGNADYTLTEKRENADGTISLLIKSNTSRAWEETESITVEGLIVLAGSGTRSTHVMLKYQNLNHVAPDSTFSGVQEKQLTIVNHTGRVNIPLHAGFIGGNHLLNDGITPNSIRIRITNPLHSQKIITAESNSKLVLVAEGGAIAEEWTLATDNQLQGFEVEYHHPSFEQGEEIPVDGTTWSFAFLPLEAGEFLEIKINNIITGHKDGHANLVLHYENIPGYADGQFILPVEKKPLIYNDKWVGIGTNDPQGNLHISSGNSGDCTLILEADIDNDRANEDDNPGILFRQDGSHDWSAILQTNNKLVLANSVSSGGGIVFKTNDINGSGDQEGHINALERMRITPEGKIGIGMSSPTGKLTIKREDNVSGLEVLSDKGDTQLPNAENLNYLSGKALLVRNEANEDKFLLDCVTGRMSIGGNVMPTAKLTINREEGVRGLEVISNNGNTHLPDSDNKNYISGKALVVRDETDENKFILDCENGKMTVGNATNPGRLQIINENKTSNGTTLVLGPTSSSNLRLGYHQDYSWIQSHHGKPLVINAISNYVGIGTTNPQKKLHIGNPNNSEWPGIRIDGNEYKGKRHFWDLILEANDKPDQDLHFFYNKSKRGWVDSTNGSFKSNSDRKLKKEIKPLGSVLDKVCSLAPKTYRWKHDTNAERAKDIGFIAQDVEKIFPNLVKDKEDTKGLSYADFGVLAIAAIQEQQVEITACKKQMEAQATLIEKLAARLTVLESK